MTSYPNNTSNRPTGIAGRMGAWSAAHRKTAIFGWLAFVIAAFVIGGSIGTRTLTQAESAAGEAGVAETALTDAGLRPASEVVIVQGQSDELKAGDPRFDAAIGGVVSELRTLDSVRNISSPLDGGGEVSADGRSALVQFEIRGDPEAAEDKIDPVLAAVDRAAEANPGMTIEEFGDASANKAINGAFADDLKKAETLSLPITMLILVIAFGSLVAAGVPLLLGLSAVLATFGLVALPSQLLPVDESVSSVILLIGLAVGVDYSLFYLRREREERAAGRSPHEALMVAAQTSGRSVLISGLTVIAAMAGLLLAGDSTFVSFGIGTILVVAVAMVASLTVLPAVLSALGDRVDRGRIPFTKRLRRDGSGRIWTAIVDGVLRRPAISLAIAGGLLIALALPAIGMKTEVTGADAFPQDLPIVKSYDRIQEAFPGDQIAASVAVQADDVRDPQVAAAIAELSDQAGSAEGLVGPASVTYAANGRVAEVDIPIAGDGNDDASQAALANLRDHVIPSAFAGVDAEVSVGGQTAGSVDFNDRLSERLPLIYAFVLGVAFLLMLVTFRSIVIPIKAIVLNLLSVAAAYGVLVLLFQDGHGESLLGFDSPGAITAWLPLFLFVVLFGLSMDYHVFIVSRIKEAVDRGMSTDAAIRDGIRATAGTVTSAAIVMVAVFAIFATLSMLDLKEMGVGLAVAVLIDATIVRAVLLPASMKLLGRWNWYLPRALGWLPRIRGEAELEVARP